MPSLLLYNNNGTALLPSGQIVNITDGNIYEFKISFIDIITFLELPTYIIGAKSVTKITDVLGNYWLSPFDINDVKKSFFCCVLQFTSPTFNFKINTIEILINSQHIQIN